ncbi:MAG: hypothetical protein E7428_08890 [Ruminococcaceae bacterium]|nr:hypothetical protein [Oscillospiraceae bacterium]
MRKIRLISFICVLVLALSLCSVFSFAAAPEADVMPLSDNSKDYFARYTTSMYAGQSTANVILSVSKGARVLGSTSNSGWSFGNGWTYVTKGAYTGYMRNFTLIPADECVKITALTDLYGTASYSGTVKATISSNTYVRYLGVSGEFYKVTYYSSNSSSITGYVPKACSARYYG